MNNPNVAQAIEQYNSKIKRVIITEEEIKRGHGGMDGIMFSRFIRSLTLGEPMDIDVYDGATWMAITALSEISIAQGGAPAGSVVICDRQSAGRGRLGRTFLSPGGVGVYLSALIRPDFPELKAWPFLWQQTEYVLGGGSTRFMFLVLAVKDLMEKG